MASSIPNLAHLFTEFSLSHKLNPTISTAESQLLVHPLLSGTEREVRVMDSRSSIGVYDKSAPHGTLVCY